MPQGSQHRPPTGAAPNASHDPTRSRAAADLVLALPESAANPGLPHLVQYLSFDYPLIDDLPFCFLPPGADGTELLARVRSFAVAGRLLIARIRWLDDLLDTGHNPGTPAQAHALARAVSRAATQLFVEGLPPGPPAARFFAVLADIQARHAASLALDGAARATRAQPLGLDLASYAEHAAARAFGATASVEASLVLADAPEEHRNRARSSLNTLAAAMQLADDVLDVEEDFRAATPSWIVAETLRLDPDASQHPDRFYEAALSSGVLLSGLDESLRLYGLLTRSSEAAFPAIRRFAAEEISRLRLLRHDISSALASPGPSLSLDPKKS